MKRSITFPGLLGGDRNVERACAPEAGCAARVDDAASCASTADPVPGVSGTVSGSPPNPAAPRESDAAAALPGRASRSSAGTRIEEIDRPPWAPGELLPGVVPVEGVIPGAVAAGVVLGAGTGTGVEAGADDVVAGVFGAWVGVDDVEGADGVAVEAGELGALWLGPPPPPSLWPFPLPFPWPCPYWFWPGGVPPCPGFSDDPELPSPLDDEDVLGAGAGVGALVG